MSSTSKTYKSDFHSDIVTIATQRVCDDLGWIDVEDASGAVTLKTPEGYAKHDMTFKISAKDIPSGGSTVVIDGKVSGLFADKSALEPEFAKLQEKIEAEAAVLTQNAIDEGYICSNCGAMLVVGNLRCEKCGTAQKQLH